MSVVSGKLKVYDKCAVVEEHLSIVFFANLSLNIQNFPIIHLDV